MLISLSSDSKLHTHVDRDRARYGIRCSVLVGDDLLHHLPSPRADVLGVAAAVRASGFKSADSYVGELRLGHIEARIEVPAWLARTLSQRKRALFRGRSPKNKAAELRFQDLVAVAEPLRGCFPSAFYWPFRTYVVANRWLLRVVVVAEARLARASISQDERLASLFLLVSKADVGGHGVERKLRCSCRGSDWDSTCPVHTLRSLIEEVARAAGSPRRRRQRGSAMVAGWLRLAPAGFTVGGHSARRSGAIRCAHEGWHITAIQHLGRWASTQVLEYVEEAYVEAQGGERAAGLHLREVVDGLKQRVQTEPHLPVGHQDNGQEEELFVLATTGSASRRKLHVRASVHWTAPSRAWSTRCGWYFSAQVFRLLRRSQVEEAPYDKCKHVGSWRRGSPRRCQKRTGSRLPSKVAWSDFSVASLLKNSSVSARSGVVGWEEHRRDFGTIHFYCTARQPNSHLLEGTREESV